MRRPPAKLDFSEAGAGQFIKRYRDTLEVSRLGEADSKPLIELNMSESMQITDSVGVELRAAPDNGGYISRSPGIASKDAPSQALTVPVGRMCLQKLGLDAEFTFQAAVPEEMRVDGALDDGQAQARGEARRGEVVFQLFPDKFSVRFFWSS